MAIETALPDEVERKTRSARTKEEHLATARKTASSPTAGKARINKDVPMGYELELICRSCGNRWSVPPGANGCFFPGFWLCPRRCDS
jgi:hypothetical protein